MIYPSTATVFLRDPRRYPLAVSWPPDPTRSMGLARHSPSFEDLYPRLPWWLTR